jgi:hypothetical protein
MAEEDGLVALQGLYSDLVAFSEKRLQDIDRLVNELDGRIEEFRVLLDKKSKADASRRVLQEGMLCAELHFDIPSCRSISRVTASLKAHMPGII